MLTNDDAIAIALPASVSWPITPEISLKALAYPFNEVCFASASASAIFTLASENLFSKAVFCSSVKVVSFKSVCSFIVSASLCAWKFWFNSNLLNKLWIGPNYLYLITIWR